MRPQSIFYLFYLKNLYYILCYRKVGEGDSSSGCVCVAAICSLALRLHVGLGHDWARENNVGTFCYTTMYWKRQKMLPGVRDKRSLLLPLPISQRL